jgi:hypothetical protein
MLARTLPETEASGSQPVANLRCVVINPVKPYSFACSRRTSPEQSSIMRFDCIRFEGRAQTAASEKSALFVFFCRRLIDFAAGGSCRHQFLWIAEVTKRTLTD